MESAAVQFIVSKLVADEVQDIRGVGDKVVLLMDELSTMNAALRIISEADQSFVDHLMRERARLRRRGLCRHLLALRQAPHPAPFGVFVIIY